MRVACMCVYKICVQTIVKTYNYFHTGVTSPPGLAFNPAFSSISVVSWSTRCCHDAQRRLKATQTSCGATPHSEQILGGELEVTGINCMNFTLGKGVLTHFGQLDSSHFLRCQIFITRPPKTFQTHWVSPVNPSLACTTKIPGLPHLPRPRIWSNSSAGRRGGPPGAPRSSRPEPTSDKVWEKTFAQPTFNGYVNKK